MIIPKEEIQHYIPQRYPFIMIDNVLEASEETFKTDFTVLSSNIFIENDELREFGLIENIAQSCAAGLALTRTPSSSKKADGYIGGISRLNLYELPRVHSTLYTMVHLIAGLETMFMLKGEIFTSGIKLLECELKLVRA